MDKAPSVMDIPEKCSLLSMAIAERTFKDPDFEVRDRARELDTSDVFNWHHFHEVVQLAFRHQFTGCLPLVFNGQFKVSEQTGLQQKAMSVSFSADAMGVYTLTDLDHREELHLLTMAELQMALRETLIQDNAVADNAADDSDLGHPSELQSGGVQYVASYGQVHKNSVPMEIIQKLPYIFMVEDELQPDLLQKQWMLIKQASQMADLEEIRQVQEKFVQMFHFKHAAIKGMFRFMDNFFVSESQAASVESSLRGFTDKAASDVSSEHFMETDPALFTHSGLHGDEPLVQGPK